MFKGLRNDTFVCMDDISGKVEELNYVIYNPLKDDPVTVPVKLFNHIKERFGVEISSDDMLRLISYDVYHLKEFVHDLKEIIEKEKI